jgi:hypothetical protein
MKACKSCEHLSDMLYAANQREGIRVKELAQAKRDLEVAIQGKNNADQYTLHMEGEIARLRSQILDAEARRQVGS